MQLEDGDPLIQSRLALEAVLSRNGRIFDVGFDPERAATGAGYVEEHRVLWQSGRRPVFWRLIMIQGEIVPVYEWKLAPSK